MIKIAYYYASSHARSHACASGMAKLSWRNHVVHFIRTYFIPYVSTIKWIMCVQEKIELSSMSLRPRLSSTKISGDFSLTTKIKQQQKLQKIFQGWQKAGILLSRDGSCHPMATGLPVPKCKLARGFGGMLPPNI